jgi:hypothetical protein
MWLRWKTKVMRTEFWWGNLFENVHLEMRGDERMPSKYILRRWVVRAGDACNWLRFVSNDGL